MSKMHHDNSSDLKEVAEVLKRVYGVCNSVLNTLFNGWIWSWACHLKICD